ncbi:MAG TPA: 6-phosphogluconolactonase, partial [Gammaproteobacteria bacterium]|nr:6-phosphogluconolactonase [Gammaproteobacteria bacterium]
MVTLANNKEIRIFADANELFLFAAKDFSQRAMTAVQDKGLFSVVLAGGSTPKLFFDALTSVEEYQKTIPWQQIQFFFGDERYVPIDDSQSNYHMAVQYLFSKVPIKPSHVYRIPTTYAAPIEAAKDYEQTLRSVFHLRDQDFPAFDLVYLG